MFDSVLTTKTKYLFNLVNSMYKRENHIYDGTFSLNGVILNRINEIDRCQYLVIQHWCLHGK